MDLPCNPQATGRNPAAGPRFCPRCGHVERDGPSLCRECGETLETQGYCPVCEAHWALSPGTPCPKHELPLEARGPGPGLAVARPDAVDPPWVTVGCFADPLRAEVPRIRLEAEGIPTFLEGERMGSPSMYQVATGGVKLQVPGSLVADARIVLSQSWALAEDNDLDDAWDDLTPDAGAIWRDLGRALVLVVLLTPLLLGLLSLWLNGR